MFSEEYSRLSRQVLGPVIILPSGVNVVEIVLGRLCSFKQRGYQAKSHFMPSMCQSEPLHIVSVDTEDVFLFEKVGGETSADPGHSGLSWPTCFRHCTLL